LGTDSVRGNLADSVFTFLASLFRRLSSAELFLLLNGFSELHQNLFRIQTYRAGPQQKRFLLDDAMKNREILAPNVQFFWKEKKTKNGEAFLHCLN
jgi:hypothetical protein